MTMVCSKCTREKLEAMFSKGHRQCAECRSEYDRIRYKQKREVILRQKAEYYSRNKELLQKKARERYRSDPAKGRLASKASHKKRREENPDKIRDASRRRSAESRDKLKDHYIRSLLKLKKSECTTELLERKRAQIKRHRENKKQKNGEKE